MSFGVTLTAGLPQIFSYADSIIGALLPVVYVTAGIALGFVIVNKIIGAFKG